jgi:hypothetical protein
MYHAHMNIIYEPIRFGDIITRLRTIFSHLWNLSEQDKIVI